MMSLLMDVVVLIAFCVVVVLLFSISIAKTCAAAGLSRAEASIPNPNVLPSYE